MIDLENLQPGQLVMLPDHTVAVVRRRVVEDGFLRGYLLVRIRGPEIYVDPDTHCSPDNTIVAVIDRLDDD